MKAENIFAFPRAGQRWLNRQCVEVDAALQVADISAAEAARVSMAMREFLAPVAAILDSNPLGMADPEAQTAMEAIYRAMLIGHLRAVMQQHGLAGSP